MSYVKGENDCTSSLGRPAGPFKHKSASTASSGGELPARPSPAMLAEPNARIDNTGTGIDGASWEKCPGAVPGAYFGGWQHTESVLLRPQARATART